MKILEVKTITKKGFESLDELIATLKHGEVAVYVESNGQKQVHLYGNNVIRYSISKCGNASVSEMLTSVDYKRFFTTYTNITTFK